LFLYEIFLRSLVYFEVEENDILRESDLLEERVTPDNSPARVGMCATGVAETAAVGICGQIFGTAKLNTEPRLTFMLPSIRSAFDGNVTQSSPVSISPLNDLSLRRAHSVQLKA
jgi:hypothetical protein